jgi:Zn-dependent protease/predicted transcriptional regulator
MAAARLRIAQLVGIPVYLHVSWTVIFVVMVWSLRSAYFPGQSPDASALVHWTQAVAATLLLFASILVHEMSHAIVARRRGVRTRSVTLFVFGGVAEFEHDPEDGGTEFRIALAGPAASLALAGLFGLAASAGGRSPATDVARFLALLNASLALFNLVPAFPLDGGRLLRGLLWRSLGKDRATRIAATAGTLFAFFLITMGCLAVLQGRGFVGVWYVLVGWFLKDASAGAYGDVRFEEALRGVTVRDVMLAPVATIPAEIPLVEAARDYFLRTGFGAYPVLRDGVLVGLLALRDLLQVPASARDATSVQAAMVPLGPGLVLDPDVPLLAAAGRMVRAGHARLLVVRDGALLGMLTLDSVMRHLQVREELSAWNK